MGEPAQRLGLGPEALHHHLARHLGPGRQAVAALQVRALAAQVGRHLVEGVHQVAQFVAAARLDARLDKVIGEGLIVKEVLLLFIRVWLEHNPPIDEALEDSAAASAEARFERFLQMVANALRGGRSISGGSVPNGEDATGAGGEFGATAP